MDAALSKLAKKDVPYAKMVPIQKDSDKTEFVEAQDERWVTPSTTLAAGIRVRAFLDRPAHYA